MVKLSAVFLVIIMVLLAGCGARDTLRNQIRPTELTAEQQEIINLFGARHAEILLFDFAVDEDFRNADFWLDAYEYGGFTERFPGIDTMTPPEGQTLGSRLAVVINRDGQDSLMFTLESAGGSATVFSRGPTVGEGIQGSLRSRIHPLVDIEDGQTIVLYVARFSREGVLSTFGDLQEYLTRPELLADYPYAHILKARFSR